MSQTTLRQAYEAAYGRPHSKKAQEEDMPVLATGKTAYEVSVLMGQAGVLPPAE